MIKIVEKYKFNCNSNYVNNVIEAIVNFTIYFNDLII